MRAPVIRFGFLIVNVLGLCLSEILWVFVVVVIMHKLTCTRKNNRQVRWTRFSFRNKRDAEAEAVGRQNERHKRW